MYKTLAQNEVYQSLWEKLDEILPNEKYKLLPIGSLNFKFPEINPNIG